MITRNMFLPALLGLGMYAQSNNLNLSNNTSALLQLMMLLTQQEEIAVQQLELDSLNAAVYGPPPRFSRRGIPRYIPVTAPYTAPYRTPIVRAIGDCEYRTAPITRTAVDECECCI